MLRFTLRRCAYSILILAGVLLLTFLLFRVAAGDPAASILGKNPSPIELEDMRRRLGSGKPLVFGDWRTSEICTNADFTGGSGLPPKVRVAGKYTVSGNGLVLQPGAEIFFPANFEIREPQVRCVLAINGTEQDFLFPPSSGFSYRNQSGKAVILSSAEFFRRTESRFDSQLSDALSEIVTFSKTAPYVSFFNFGETLLTREPIREVLLRGMAASLLLMLPVFFGELIVGIVLAMISAIHRGHWPDRVILVLSVAGMSISYLVLIIAAQWLFGYYLNWFPVWGWGSLRYLLLPVLVGIISGTGSGVRFYRTVFLNEMNREYLRTAAAKGCSSSKIYFYHLLKNAAIPIITRASAVLPFLFTGSLLLESFFGIPGLGFKGVDALNSSDLQTLKALVILGSFLFVLINLIADLLYAWADPRVRLK